MQIEALLDSTSEQGKYHADMVMLALHGNKCNVQKDNELAELFASCYKHIARFNSTANEWFVYNGVNWEQDTGGCIAAELAKDFYKRLWQYMWNTAWSSAPDDDAAKSRNEAQQKAVGALHKLSRRRTLLEDARSIYPFRTEELDTDPWILNTQNFTINLRTTECKPHNPDDLISHVAGVDYDPAATCPRFMQFLSEIFSEPTESGYRERPDLVEFLQQSLGYALTGSVTEDCLFMAYGATTRNGKTTLMESILSVMGTYGCTTKPDTLAYTGKPNGSGASEDVARLKGKRFVSISEPQKAMHLDAAKVKDMTGGGTQVARFLHQNSFEFKPEFKIFIDTNYRPRVTDETLFTSGRIHVLPFERHFTDEERDRDLAEKLEAEKSGILNWMLEGLEKLLENGHLKPCDDVIKATKEYQEESDKVGQFFNERMERSSENCKGGEVYKAYCDWCADSNLHPQSKGLFFDDLRKRGFMYPCIVNGVQDKNGVVGWRIIPEEERWRDITNQEPPRGW